MASEFLIVAEKVLELTRRPMSAKEIVSFAIEQGVFSDKRAGRTPHQTMKSKLSQEIRRCGQCSRFVRTSPGRFLLRSLVDSASDVYYAHPYGKPRSHERVLVVPSDFFSRVVQFQGLSDKSKAVRNRLLRQDRCDWLDRIAAEGDDGYKQVLTYVVVTRRGSVLCFKRGNYSRVESFLRGSRCIGFGGHVSELDSFPLFPPPDQGVSECVVRELCEELTIPLKDRQRLLTAHGLTCCGVLNDDSSAVGRRHFAFVYRYEVSRDPGWHKPTRGEKSITQLQWLSDRSKPIPIWHFEYWSQLVLRTFFPQLVRTEQAYRIVCRKPLTPPHLLCLVGEVGSGKSETAQILRREYGYEEVNTGHVLAELLNIPPIPTTPREEFQARAWEFISSPNGPTRLAQAIVQRASKLSHGRVLIDGVRQRDTLDRLRLHFASRTLGVLYVYTPPDMAYRFCRTREKKDISFDGYLAIRDALVEKEVADMIALADGVLYNWTGQAFHAATVRSMYNELGVEKA